MIGKLFLGLGLVVFMASSALAETATYGDVDLYGLSRNNSWPLNPPGNDFAMVCNVNGPDGWLAIRSGPGTNFTAKRKLKRLSILEIDTRERKGHWVKVRTAHRDHTPNGRLQAHKNLHVTGWAHDDHLCDFIA